MDITWNTVHSIECGGYNDVGSVIADTMKGRKLLNSCIGRYPTIVMCNEVDTIYIKTQVFRLLRYYSPAPRNIARSDWATQNITYNMTSSIT